MQLQAGRMAPYAYGTSQPRNLRIIGKGLTQPHARRRR